MKYVGMHMMFMITYVTMSSFSITHKYLSGIFNRYDIFLYSKSDSRVILYFKVKHLKYMYLLIKVNYA